MNKEEKAKIEKQYQEAKTPYDRIIKICVKELSRIKSDAFMHQSRLDNIEERKLEWRTQLDYFKDQADDYKINKWKE